jgi:hypothetical protein
VNTTVHDAETNMVCDRPRDNWLVFTAGCMGAGEYNDMVAMCDDVRWDSERDTVNMYTRIEQVVREIEA